jgi:predicted glycoside hydrolase/deacetylase ChbG (UPF0249 family)/putative flippase GtrA
MPHDIIFHADDCGRTDAITDGVIAAIDAGSVQSTSVMAVGTGLSHAAHQLQSRPQVAVRVHLSLTEGTAQGDHAVVAPLCAHTGELLNSYLGLLVRYACADPETRTRFERAVCTEFTAQIRAVTHVLPGRVVGVDGHEHIQTIPWIARCMAESAREAGISFVRLAPEHVSVATTLFRHAPLHAVNNIGKWMVYTIGSWRARLALRHTGIQTGDAIAGVLASGHINADAVYAAASVVHHGVLEVIMHPGRAAAHDVFVSRRNRQFYHSRLRDGEHAFLTSGAALRVRTTALQGGIGSMSEHLSASLGRICKFGITGLIASVVHLGVMYLTTELFGVWYVLGGAIGFGIAYGVSFTLQKYWTFKNHDHMRVGSQALLYFLIALSALIANVCLVYVLVEFVGMWYLAAQTLVLLGVSVATFYAYRLLFSAHTI